jgi:hypothetical protein
MDEDQLSLSREVLELCGQATGSFNAQHGNA